DESCDRADSLTDGARFDGQIVLEPADHPQSGRVLEDHETKASRRHAALRRKRPTDDLVARSDAWKRTYCFGAGSTVGFGDGRTYTVPPEQSLARRATDNLVDRAAVFVTDWRRRTTRRRSSAWPDHRGGGTGRRTRRAPSDTSRRCGRSRSARCGPASAPPDRTARIRASAFHGRRDRRRRRRRTRPTHAGDRETDASGSRPRRM